MPTPHHLSLTYVYMPISQLCFSSVLFGLPYRESMPITHSFWLGGFPGQQCVLHLAHCRYFTNIVFLSCSENWIVALLITVAGAFHVRPIQSAAQQRDNYSLLGIKLTLIPLPIKWFETYMVLYTFLWYFNIYTHAASLTILQHMETT